MRTRAMLMAAAVLVVALGAGAVWVAAKDDDHPSANLFSSSEDPARGGAPAPEQGPEATTPPPTQLEVTPDDQGAPTISEQPPETGAPAEPPASDEPPASTPKQKTHFKREPKGAQRDDQPERKFVVPPAHQFSGEGNAHLGTIDVKATSVLKWRTKGRFEVRFGREAFPIIAPTSTGQLVVPPFIFTEVSVKATGRWRITISPQ